MFFVLIFAKEKSGPEFLLNFPKSKISKGFPSESLKSNVENILYFHRYWSRFSFMVS